MSSKKKTKPPLRRAAKLASIAPTRKDGERPPSHGRNLAIFTSGGDSDGMNATLCGCVRYGLFMGAKMFFIREGYLGMIAGGDQIVEATWQSVDNIIQEGGTIIGSARSEEFRTPAGRKKAAANLLKHQINGLICIGGDGSLTGADMFSSEWPSIVADLVKEGVIPKETAENCGRLTITGMVGSIDNDFWGTDMTIGVDSALQRITTLCDWVKTTMDSHQRVVIVRVMGRHCGYLSLVAGIVTESTYVFIPEWPPKEGKNWPEMLVKKVRGNRGLGQRYNIIIACEGAKDLDGDDITVDHIKKALSEFDTRITDLGHPQRGGPPSAFDRTIGLRMGTAAINTDLAASTEKDKNTGALLPRPPSYVVGLERNKIGTQPLAISVKNTIAVAEAMKAKNYEEAVKARGPSFERILEVIRALNRVDRPPTEQPRDGSMLGSPKVGILCVGRAAPGMNATIRAAVRSALIRRRDKEGNATHPDLTPVGIYGGFETLMLPEVPKGLIRTMSWTDVTNWVSANGTLLATSDVIPTKDDHFRMITAKVKEYNLQGLVVIGDFSAFAACLSMTEGDDCKRLPGCHVTLIPASEDSSVPGTDLSIGCDSTLNSLVCKADALRLLTGNSRKIFLLKIVGHSSGFLALLGGLDTDCTAPIYSAETNPTADSLAEDVQSMVTRSKRRAINRGGFMIMSESSPVTEHAIRAAYEKEGFTVVTKYFDHGTDVSPFDRCLGTQLGFRAMENMATLIRDQQGNMTVDVLGLRGRDRVYTDIRELRAQADLVNRRPLTGFQSWTRLVQLARILSRIDETYDSALGEWRP